MQTSVYINIGSNSGDRRALTARAAAAIVSAFPEATVRQSEPFESEPWGFDSDNTFVNIGLAVDMWRSTPWTASDLHALLDTTQAIERSISAMPHRNPDGTYRDREIDIDIIAVDDIAFTSPRLTLPHPRMHLRPFVMTPMAELAPANLIERLTEKLKKQQEQ